MRILVLGDSYCPQLSLRPSLANLPGHEVTFADGFAATPGPGSDNDGRPETNIVLGENCWVGARTVLLAGTRIGTGSIIGAGTVVDFDVPPYVVVAGNPARVVGSTIPVTRPGSGEERK